MATINKLTATIGVGQSLSNVIDTGANFVVGLIMPTTWTQARVSVTVSTDSVNWCDLFSFEDRAGTTAVEFQFNVTPGAIVAINPNTMLMVRYIRLRSGTRDAAVPQAAARVFTVITANSVSTQLLPALEIDE